MGQIFKSLFWVTVQRWGNKVLSTLTFIVLARFLNSEDFGLLSLSLIVIEFTELLISQGMGLAIIQDRHLTDKKLHTAFWFNVTVGALSTGVLLLLAGSIAHYFKNDRLTAIIQVISFSLLFSGAARVPTSIIIREMKFNIQTNVTLFTSFIGTVVSIVLAVAGKGVWSLVVSYMITVLLSSVLLLFYCRWRPKPIFVLAELKELYGRSFKIYLDAGLLFILRKVDEIFIAKILGSSNLGYYVIGKKFLVLLNEMIGSVIQSVSIPYFAKGKTEDSFNSYLEMSKLLSFIVMPLVFSIFFYPDIFVRIFGNKWDVSIPVVRILIVCAIPASIPVLTDILMYAHNRTGIPISLKVVQIIVGLSIFYLPIRWDLHVVALITLLREFFYAFLVVICLKYLFAFTQMKKYLLSIFYPFSTIILFALTFVPLKKILDMETAIVTQVLTVGAASAIIYLLFVFGPARKYYGDYIQSMSVAFKRIALRKRT